VVLQAWAKAGEALMMPLRAVTTPPASARAKTSDISSLFMAIPRSL
jgi:hypothetical protein